MKSRLMVGLFALVAAHSHATSITITTSSKADVAPIAEADLTITAAPHTCSLKVVKSKLLTPCTLTLEPKPEQSLTIKGLVTFEKATKITIDQTITVFDIAPQIRIIESLAEPLAQADFVDRLRQLNAAHNRMIESKAKASGSDELPASGERISSQTTSSTEITRAETRLGFPLPEAFRQSWLTLGALRFGGGAASQGAMSQPRSMQVIGERGFRDAIGLGVADARKMYGASAVEAMLASIVIYARTGEVQDLLLYRSKGEQACEQRPAFYWVANDTAQIRPLIEGGACLNDLQTYRWLLLREYGQLRLRGDTAVIYLDTSKPNKMFIDGTHENGGAKLKLQ